MIETISSQLSSLRGVKFYKINLSLNDIPELQLSYVPAFGGYIRGNKELELYEDEKISYDKILDFIYDSSKLFTKEQYEELKKEADALYFDSLMVTSFF